MTPYYLTGVALVAMAGAGACYWAARFNRPDLLLGSCGRA